MLQGLVSRMAGYGATFKSYCITVTTAVCGFAITLQRPLIAALAILPIVTFACIDAQYLRVERRFRALFDRVRAEDWATMPKFEINLASAPAARYRAAILSWSIASFYVPLAIGVVIILVIARIAYGI
jgi:hypothetical protein